jgi:hypothetical protein
LVNLWENLGITVGKIKVHRFACQDFLHNVKYRGEIFTRGTKIHGEMGALEDRSASLRTTFRELPALPQ